MSQAEVRHADQGRIAAFRRRFERSLELPLPSTSLDVPLLPTTSDANVLLDMVELRTNAKARVREIASQAAESKSSLRCVREIPKEAKVRVLRFTSLGGLVHDAWQGNQCSWTSFKENRRSIFTPDD